MSTIEMAIQLLIKRLFTVYFCIRDKQEEAELAVLHGKDIVWNCQVDMAKP